MWLSINMPKVYLWGQSRHFLLYGRNQPRICPQCWLIANRLFNHPHTLYRLYEDQLNRSRLYDNDMRCRAELVSVFAAHCFTVLKLLKCFNPMACSSIYRYIYIVLHIDTADIAGIDICPPIHVSILWYPPNRYISIKFLQGFTGSILQKNTANTFWRAKMIIYILSITLFTFNPIVIFTGSP